MTSEIVEHFRKDLAEVCWRDLRIHLQRDALITLTEDKEMVEVATAIARDDKDRVQSWISAGNLAKPTREEIEAWEQNLEKPFRMLIVQPYILIQAVSHA